MTTKAQYVPLSEATLSRLATTSGGTVKLTDEQDARVREIADGSARPHGATQ